MIDSHVELDHRGVHCTPKSGFLELRGVFKGTELQTVKLAIFWSEITVSDFKNVALKTKQLRHGFFIHFLADGSAEFFFPTWRFFRIFRNFSTMIEDS